MEDRQPLKVLTDYRQTQGMTPAELARFLGMPRPTVHRWETGARKIGPGKLKSVSEKTGIPTRDLRPDLAEMIEVAS